MKELEKNYNPSEIEDKLYQKWLQNHYSHAEPNPNKKPLTTVMPPPDITGQLHMGHTLDNTMQDILTCFKRVQGYKALWQSGTDHAATATEVKVIESLRGQGLGKDQLGRDGFLEKCWDWRKEYGGKIINQLHKLGSSADWDRERLTMDEGYSDAVLEVFIELYEKGYIYKGSRTINWCSVCQTSISDAEVEHQEQDGFFWHINYPIVGEEGWFVEIATARPETLLGDTAVAANPEDERYQDLIRKMLKLPLTDHEIPVVAGPYVDKKFGTGCVKITPAHDPSDFEVGRRHNLPELTIMHDDATIDLPGSKYDGMERYKAREAMVEDLKEQGLLVKIVPHSHSVETHDRCRTTVEPMIKQQWFVKIDEMAKLAIEALKSGELKFVPESFGETYLHWLENICDWCIFRRLWWGHRIPAYYCEDCGEIVVSRQQPKKYPKRGCIHLEQDEDTLGAWFSSALWPFSTPGWPKQTRDLEHFYPTDVLMTGYDIIFFWVIRMVFSGTEQTGKTPFHTVLIHGLVRDSEGQKMSKSLGNDIDPLEVIDKYGADVLRMILITENAPGNDMRFYWERVEASRNSANKVWGASRFIMMNIEKAPNTGVSLDNLTMADRWILSKASTLVKDITEDLDKYELGTTLQKVYDFVWEEFYDWYIEMVKPRLWAEEDTSKAAAIWMLKAVLIQSLKLLHPYIPFITEEIFCSLWEEGKSIIIPSWPEYRKKWSFKEEGQAVETIKEAVRTIRNVCTPMNVPPNRKAKVYVVSENQELLQIPEYNRVFFATLGYASEVSLQADKTGIADDAVPAMIPQAVIYMPFAELVDISKEIERLAKEEERLAKELARMDGMLANERFVSKAPEAKIQEERDKREKYAQMIEQVQARLSQLQ